MTRIVHVVGSSPAYVRMFEHNGWKATDSIFDADLVQFTGGEDVTPWLYGEEPHVQTVFNTRRDREEAFVFLLCRGMGIPMAGICRGGQFLNVMNGGKMLQHIDDNRHCVGNHEATFLEECEEPLFNETIEVSSTHHQMMIPNLGKGEVLADANLVGEKDGGPANYDGLYIGYDAYGFDAESVMYLKNKCLCFQPHPEFFQPGHECFELFFEHLNYFMKQLEK